MAKRKQKPAHLEDLELATPLDREPFWVTVDMEKVKTLEDVIAIMRTMELSVDAEHAAKHGITHLLKKEQVN